MTKDKFDQMVEAMGKDIEGDTLSVKDWTPEAGDVIQGVFVHREIAKGKETEKLYDIITIRTDDGPFKVLLKQGVLALAKHKVEYGDTFIVRYDGLVPIGDGKRSMHQNTIRVFYTGDHKTPF